MVQPCTVARGAFIDEPVFSEANIPRNLKDCRTWRVERMIKEQILNWKKHQKFLLAVAMRRELNGEKRYIYVLLLVSFSSW